MKYLLDTSACVDTLRDRDPVVSRVRAQSPYDLAISAVNLLELEVGVHRGTRGQRERERLDRLLTAPIRVLPFDDGTARVCARLEHMLRAQPIGVLDLMIASVAVVHDLTVVTHNVREFGRVPGLRVENWSRAGER